MQTIIQLLNIGIFLLLCAGAYSDIKTRTVSNKITFSIIGLSLISISIQGVDNIYLNTYVKLTAPLLFSLLFILLYFRDSMGGADMKVLIPLVFVVPDVVGFVLLISLLGMVYAIISWSKNIPYFVPIALGFGGLFFG